MTFSRRQFDVNIIVILHLILDVKGSIYNLTQMQCGLCNCREMSISDPICLLKPVALCEKQDTEKKSNLLHELAAFSS